MDNLQLVLINSNRSSTDLTVFLSESERQLFVYLGVALLERVSNDPNSFAYKMLVGRLLNAGTGVTELASTFGHDVRTIKKWAEALLSNDPELVVRAFAGRGPLPKVSAPLVRFVKGRYLRLRNVVSNYRQQIAEEVSECFRVTLSRETLRRLFVLARQELLDAPDQLAQQYADTGSMTENDGEPHEADGGNEQSDEESVPEQIARHTATTAGDAPEQSDEESGPEQIAQHCATTAGDAPEQSDEESGPEQIAQHCATAAGDELEQTNEPAEQAEQHQHYQDDSDGTTESGDSTPGTNLPCQVANSCHPSRNTIDTGDGDDNHSPLSLGEGSPSPLPSSPFMPRQDDREACPTSGIPVSGKQAPRRTRIFHHAGQILFSVYMDVFTAFRRHAFGLQTQWIGQILQGAVNIEQSRLICAPSLELFTGPITSLPDDQRTALGELANVETVLDVYAANARLLPDGPGEGTIFYYDPHSKECTTTLWNLLKGWCGGPHRIAKLLHMDFIHTESGCPCFLQHYDNFYDMRERFFITLELFARLFPRHSVAGSTFIIDRGIAASDMFERFGFYGCDLITWEKGYARDGWEPEKGALVFNAYRTRNTADDLREYTFECQESCWDKDPSVRRIIVRATNPNGRTIEVSILCSDKRLSIKRIVMLMFNRWIQENDFKYGDRHFGWMQITSYAIESYEKIADQLRDREVECPEYRALKRRSSEAEKELGKLLVKHKRTAERLADKEGEHDRIAQCIAHWDTPPSGGADQASPPLAPSTRPPKERSEQLREYRARLRSLNRSIAQLKRSLTQQDARIKTRSASLKELGAELDSAIRKRSRLELLIEGRYQRLDMRRKAMLDALRVTASNMFRQTLAGFRQVWGNHRNDHVMLRMLSRCDGLIGSHDGIIEISLWLKGRYQPHQKGAFTAFLNTMTTLINTHFVGRATPIRLSLLDSAADLLSPLPKHGVPFVTGSCSSQ